MAVPAFASACGCARRGAVAERALIRTNSSRRRSSAAGATRSLPAMTAATAGGAANVRGLPRQGHDDVRLSGSFVIDLVTLDSTPLDGDEDQENEQLPFHLCEGFVMTEDETVKLTVGAAMKRRDRALVDENNFRLPVKGALMGMVKGDEHGQWDLGTLAVLKNAVCMGGDGPLLLNFYGLVRIKVVQLLPIVNGRRLALVRPFFDQADRVKLELDGRLARTFRDFVHEVERAETLTEGRVSAETQAALAISASHNGALSRLQREAMCFYACDLLRLDRAQRQMFFRSTSALTRMEMAIWALSRRPGDSAVLNADTLMRWLNSTSAASS